MSFIEILELIQEKEYMIQDTRGETQQRHLEDLDKLNAALEKKIRSNDLI